MVRLSLFPLPRALLCWGRLSLAHRSNLKRRWGIIHWRWHCDWKVRNSGGKLGPSKRNTNSIQFRTKHANFASTMWEILNYSLKFNNSCLQNTNAVMRFLTCEKIARLTPSLSLWEWPRAIEGIFSWRCIYWWTRHRRSAFLSFRSRSGTKLGFFSSSLTWGQIILNKRFRSWLRRISW